MGEKKKALQLTRNIIAYFQQPDSCVIFSAQFFFVHTNTPFALVFTFSFWISCLLFFAIRKRIFPYSFFCFEHYKTMVSSLQLTQKYIQKSEKENRIYMFHSHHRHTVRTKSKKIQRKMYTHTHTHTNVCDNYKPSENVCSNVAFFSLKRMRMSE